MSPRYGIALKVRYTNDMSYKTENSASITLNHDPQRVIDTLLEVEKLPSWNPALTYVGPADPRGKHPITVQNLLKGNLVYKHPNPHYLELNITIPGLTERSTFTLMSQGIGTRVTHTVFQHGFLSAVIGDHEASLVPSKRLTRLAHILDNQ